MSSNQRPGESRRQYQWVADLIRAHIENGGLRAGARLPGERELALQLGVSRTSLREALIALKIDRRVDIRVGSGVYVCDATAEGEGRKWLPVAESPAELMQARVTVEVGIVTLAAARVTKAGLRKVDSALRAMRNELVGGHDPVDADRRFHLRVAEMAGNAVMADIAGTLFDRRHRVVGERLDGRVEPALAWQAALAEHEAIYRALEERNPQAAALAMGSHLQASLVRWEAERAEGRASV